MSASPPGGERDVIPRWRDPVATARQGELDSLASPSGNMPHHEALFPQEEAWSKHRSLAFAVDLVGSALVVGSSSTAEEAARFVLEQARDAGSLAVSIAREVVDGPIHREQEVLD